MSSRVLLIIDLQISFFVPEGLLKDAFINKDEMIPPIQALTTQSWSKIIWIKSAYIPSDLADFIISPVKDDIIVTKSEYSAFKKTDLDRTLRNLNVETVHICGVTTNNCVRATALDAVSCGFQIVLEESAVMARSPETNLRAIDKISREAVGIKSKVLYIVNGSIPSWRCQILLHELDICHQAKRLRVMCEPRETKSPEFLAINERGTTPVWVDEEKNVTICDSKAIMHYLISKSKVSVSPLVLERMYQADLMRDYIGKIEQVYKEGVDMSGPKLATEGLESIEVPIWERRLQNSSFIAGNEFTVADCGFFPVLAYLIRRGYKPAPLLSQYYDRMCLRPSVRNSFPIGWEPRRTGRDLFKEIREAQ